MYTIITIRTGVELKKSREEARAMKHLTPQKIAEITEGEYIGSNPGRSMFITGAARDNREVKQGDLFVCIRGARTDGHLFANKAFESGAACCLAEQTIPDANGPYVLVKSTLDAIKKVAGYYRRQLDIPIVGITGSVGKTTTKELVSAVVGAKLKVHKTAGNLNNELGVPLTLLSIQEWHEAAVIEMGISDFGEMSRLAEIARPDIFIITKIGYSHTDKLGDLNGVLKAKTEAIAYMETDGVAIVNGDDTVLKGFDPGIRKITFGLEKQNDYRAENIRTEGIDFVTCEIASDNECFPVKIPAYGNHIAQMALPAAIVGRLLGLSNSEISSGLLTYMPVSGRANIYDTGYIRLIDDCYNANPHSVEAALTSLSSLPGRHVAILGDMLGLGALSEDLHSKIGDFCANARIDVLICCGDKAAHIRDAYISASGKAALFYPGKAGLIKALQELIKKGDAVLVKASHGMQFEELVAILKNL